MIRFRPFTTLVLIQLAMASAPAARAAGADATVLELQGEVQIFSHPGDSPRGPPPHARFEGKYYSVRAAAPGDRMEAGDIIRTATDARARVAFGDGDQITVGTGTAFHVEERPNHSLLLLAYGKIRAVILRLGTHTKMEVRTKDTLMGIRGTDFFVSHRAEKGTDLFVIRGDVEMKSLAAEAAGTPSPATTVSAGNTARVRPADTGPVAPRPATKADLSAVRNATSIDPAKAAAVPREAATRVEVLRAKVAETAAQDIQRTDPDLYEELSEDETADAARMSERAIEKVSKEAPDAAKAEIIEVEPAKKEEEPSKPDPELESWYLRLGVGPAIASYSGTETVEEIVRRKDASGGSGGHIDVGVLFPRGDRRTLFGFTVQLASERIEGDSSSGGRGADVEQLFGGLSAMRFYGGVAGKGLFLRADAGIALLRGETEGGPASSCSGSSCSSTSSTSGTSTTQFDDVTKIGLGALVGGGYSLPLFWGMRFTLGVSASLRVAPGFQAFNLLPTIGFIF